MSSDEAVRYAVDLAKKNSDAVSFIPTPRLEEYQRRGQILFARENGDLSGFLVFGAGYPTLKVYQACVQYDARRRKSGLEMIDRLKEIARREGRDISLWCAQDLEANEFWNAAGFNLIGERQGGVRRGRKHNAWFFPVLPSLLPTDGAALDAAKVRHLP